MIPLPDDFLLKYTTRNIAWLKHNPVFLSQIFHTSTRETVDKMEQFLTSRSIHVTLGFPRDPNLLPTFAIVMAPESEVPLGLGDEFGTFDDMYYGTTLDPEPEVERTEEEQQIVDYAEDHLRRFLENTSMRASYRIECWADNADVVTYMYAIAKWSLWASRRDMYRLHWTNVSLSGMDLEPLSEYLPVFVFRRALQITMEYENVYYTDINALGKYGDMIVHPDDHVDDPDIDLGPDTWVLCPKYYTYVQRISGYEI